MDLDNNNNNSASSGDCVVLSLSPIAPVLSEGTDTPKRSTSKIRLSKVESVSTMIDRKINSYICIDSTKI